MDYVALSFVRSADDVRAVRRILNRHGSSIGVVAKLEKPQAVDNLEAIIAEADAIMVARGDLGVELPPEQVPVLQKRMIRFSRAAGKPVITATQMLESMVKHSKPTRAEASDVANAVYDGTDALMLSAETASGKYPVESVAMMDRIIRSAEASRSYVWGAPNAEIDMTLADAVGAAAAETAQHLEARAITVFTQSGGSARVVAKYRPRVPIYAFTPLDAVYRRLSLVWGVEPRLVEPLPTTDDMVDRVARLLLSERRVKRDDLIVVTAGTPVHQPGTTNFIKFHRVTR